MELEEKILKDIEKTGFVTELKAVSLLIEKGWSAEHSTTYEDKDENRSREIDIIASKVEYVKELGFRLTIYLVVEVKKSERPWIIFTTDKKFRTPGWAQIHNGYNTSKWEKYAEMKEGGYYSTVFDLDCISRKSPRENVFRIGKAFHELEKSPNDKSNIYSALICSGKAAKYFCDRYNYGDQPKDFELDTETDLSLFLPTVVLDGHLFEVYNGSSGEMKVKKESYIPVEMKYSSPNYRDGNWDIDFFPDVVTFDYLSTYIDNIESWRQSMIKKMTKQLRDLGKLPDKRAPFY